MNAPAWVILSARERAAEEALSIAAPGEPEANRSGTAIANSPFQRRHRTAVTLHPTAPDSNHASTPRPQTGRTVLYVEDHPVNVLLMQALFRKRPQHRLVVATSGAAGQRAALEKTPDLMLLDLRLPDCHGTELLQRLRCEPSLARVPAVAVTAEDTSEHGVCGFSEVWHKPMDLHAALLRLDRILERSGDEHTNTEASTMPAAPAWARVAGHSRRPPPAPIPFSPA
jgi:CheY-like chemotaxis protein